MMNRRKVRARHCEEGAVLLSLDNLLSYPWISSKVEEGSLKLHALYYDLGEGELYRFSPEKEDFLPLALKTPKKSTK